MESCAYERIIYNFFVNRKFLLIPENLLSLQAQDSGPVSAKFPSGAGLRSCVRKVTTASINLLSKHWLHFLITQDQ